MSGWGFPGVAFALAVTLLVGWAVARFFSGELARGERFAWSLATGLAVQSVAVLAAAGAGLPLRRWVILSFDAAILGVCGMTGRGRQRESPPRLRRPGVLAIVLLCAAGAAWLAFLLPAISEPMWSTDYLAIWGLKGKLIFQTGGLPARLFRDPALYWAHREYPLLLPLTLAALATLAGEWNDQALALLFPVLAAATLCGLFGFLRRRGMATAGAAAALLTALCFRLYHPVNVGSAEVPFALAAVLASCAMLDVLDRDDGEVRGRLAAAALLCASIKQEGTLWVALLAAAILLRALFSRRTAPLVAACALTVVPAVHWVTLHFLRGPQTRREFDFRLLTPARARDLLATLGSVWARVLTVEAREAAVALAAILLFLLVTRRAFADILLPTLAVQIAFYCLAFSVSSFDPMYAVDAAFRRIALTLFPVLTLVLGARISGQPGKPEIRKLETNAPPARSSTAG